MKRTDEEIAAEIAKLHGLKDRIRQVSAFGDSNRTAIEAQIETLEHEWDEDDVYTEFATDADNVLDSALEARKWADGDENGAPSTGWESLVQ